MGNSLEVYRAAVGTFHLTSHGLISQSLPKFNIRFSIYCAVNIWCLLGLKCYVKTDKFALHTVLLLQSTLVISNCKGLSEILRDIRTSTYQTCRMEDKFALHTVLLLQSTLVISNCKGLSEILRDIRTSTYQTCRIEEKLNRLTTFNKYMCNWTLEVRDILKILWKEEKLLVRSNFSSFLQYFFHVVRFSYLGREQIFHFEISGYSR